MQRKHKANSKELLRENEEYEGNMMKAQREYEGYTKENEDNTKEI